MHLFMPTILSYFLFASLTLAKAPSRQYIATFNKEIEINNIHQSKTIKLNKVFGPLKRFALIETSLNIQDAKKELENINGFASLSLNEKIELSPSIKNNNPKNSKWWQETIKQNQAHQINKGSQELIVAVLDTGVDYLHHDLRDNIYFNDKEVPGNGIDDDNNGKIDDYYGFNFYSNYGSGMDDNGHGTHCAGIIAANGELIGVAPNVKILPLKFLNNYGSGDIAKAIDAIAYAVDMGAKILTNSYGNPNSNQAFLSAINYAKENGVLFFAAAGNAKNDNDSRGEYPANYFLDNVVSIAASNSSERKASFTNYGQLSVDLFAPGDSIYSLDTNNRYKVRSGTSMATPMAAGVASLIWSEFPNLSYLEVLDILFKSSYKSENYFPYAQNPGRIDSLAALKKEENPNQYPFPRSSVKEELFELQSDSPYQSNTTKPYQIGWENAKKLALSFALIDIENGYDYLQIETLEGKVLKKITGKINPGQTEFFDAEKLVLRIISDHSEQRAGFIVDKIKYIPND